MRRWRSLLVAPLAAAVTLLGAWLVMLWSDAGAPALSDFGQRHPVLGAVFGLLSTAFVLVSASANHAEPSASSALASRFADTGSAVFSSWANSETRHSSISQRNSSGAAVPAARCCRYARQYGITCSIRC